MSHLSENDACPYCWHETANTSGPVGIGTYSIEDLITHKGGNLDKYGTCNICKWNFVLIKNCTNCTKNTACPECYASGYDGTLNEHTPLMIHNLYMRNSHYKKSWDERPKSIGEWYANQVRSSMDIISILKRFTSNYRVNAELNLLERTLPMNKSMFWSKLKAMCLCYFTGDDDISVAINAFCCRSWQLL